MYKPIIGLGKGGRSFGRTAVEERRNTDVGISLRNASKHEISELLWRIRHDEMHSIDSYNISLALHARPGCPSPPFCLAQQYMRFLRHPFVYMPSYPYRSCEVHLLFISDRKREKIQAHTGRHGLT